MMLRWMVPLVTCLAWCTVNVQGETVILDPDRVFSSATEAYERGEYDEAAEQYEQMMAAGYRDKAVTFNLGNAYFRAGDNGRAVLNYRRAWYEAPRDPDIRTNLEHVRNKAHLVFPESGAMQRMLQTLEPGEWATGLVLALWATSLCFSLSLYRERGRTSLRRAALAGVWIMLVSGAGLWQWHTVNQVQEAVVTQPNQQVKYGPLAAAKPHFDVPPGTLLRVKERSAGWLQVSLNEKTGWIKESACSTVHP